MAIISVSSTNKTDYEDASFFGGSGPSGEAVDILFNDATGMSGIIASLTRARILVAQYFDNQS